VLGTREGLEHVVQNLIDNAVKYSADQKSLRALLGVPPPYQVPRSDRDTRRHPRGSSVTLLALR